MPQRTNVPISRAGTSSSSLGPAQLWSSSRRRSPAGQSWQRGGCMTARTRWGCISPIRAATITLFATPANTLTAAQPLGLAAPNVRSQAPHEWGGTDKMGALKGGGSLGAQQRGMRRVEG
jgi:hypothetical protein